MASTTATSSGRWCASPAPSLTIATADDLFPSLTFRTAYDVLQRALPTCADKEYLRLLHLAASTSESDVEAALALVAEHQQVPTFDAVRQLVRDPAPPVLPSLTRPNVDLAGYDCLLSSGAVRV